MMKESYTVRVDLYSAHLQNQKMMAFASVKFNGSQFLADSASTEPSQRPRYNTSMSPP